MIASGEKKAEYRELKDYWWSRLFDYNTGKFYKFNVVEFRNGYSKNSPKIRVECLGIMTGKALPQWSDNYKEDVFVIKLGQITHLPTGV